ncbi:MAG: signal peptidase II [Candidatus Aminicenantes bacterium]|nr:signal peptidase II [Candidatus Aminicenantes bacterium]
MKPKFFFLALAGVLFAADQLSKGWVEARLFEGQALTVIPGFFNIVHVRNRGAIFGFLSGSGDPWVRAGLLAAALAALAFVLYYFFKTPASEKGTLAGLMLILAGALGNQISRFRFGYVVDFLDVHVGNAHWPSFNVADSCITIGAVWLIASFLFRRRVSCCQR